MPKLLLGFSCWSCRDTGLVETIYRNDAGQFAYGKCSCVASANAIYVPGNGFVMRNREDMSAEDVTELEGELQRLQRRKGYVLRLQAQPDVEARKARSYGTEADWCLAAIAEIRRHLSTNNGDSLCAAH